MKISIINTGYFKLDGGAMFGIVPKVMWKKVFEPDEKNYLNWAMRCLLVETGNRKILIDTGMGSKQDEKFRSHFQPFGEDSLLGSLAEKGLKAEDITDVLLTHFHFDHVGGALVYDKNGQVIPTFPNAKYWTNDAHYNWAYDPNPRERASFLKENFVPLKEQGILEMLDVQQGLEWLPNIELYFVNGHTEAMMLPKITVGDKTYLYCADLIASSAHLGLPYVMGYDIRPLDTMREKEHFLNLAYENDWQLIFEHDPLTESCTLAKDKKGRIAVGERLKL